MWFKCDCEIQFCMRRLPWTFLAMELFSKSKENSIFIREINSIQLICLHIAFSVCNSPCKKKGSRPEKMHCPHSKFMHSAIKSRFYSTMQKLLKIQQKLIYLCAHKRDLFFFLLHTVLVWFEPVKIFKQQSPSLSAVTFSLFLLPGFSASLQLRFTSGRSSHFFQSVVSCLSKAALRERCEKKRGPFTARALCFERVLAHRPLPKRQRGIFQCDPINGAAPRRRPMPFCLCVLTCCCILHGSREPFPNGI